ncbi:MAG TPA: monofunctional biosynthetic peptidoglycan transglycosylase [candidate division Zixibacteria bacterium]|nr:monofunctional biosynthetic peptidoglycan transglycosylase [candidate division Zixibacteria bacterium]
MKRVLLKSLLLAAFAALLFYFYASLPDVAPLRRQNPRTTALMELRDREYREKKIHRPRQQIWVPYGAISEHLKKAVLLSEDAAFFSHSGVDLNELREAFKKDWETLSFRRGGSTITMQLARNLYLSPSKNPLRKAREIVIAWRLERALSKRRIFELYLNVVEWGPNVYGAEAAAHRYFGKPASALDEVEGATLAALLPNPREWREKGVLLRRNLILSRMARVGHISEASYAVLKETPLLKKNDGFSPAWPAGTAP